LVAANVSLNVIPHGMLVGLPKQQPANRHPKRPTTWPSAIPAQRRRRSSTAAADAPDVDQRDDDGEDEPP
jgi:hypothetical protein